VYTDKAPIELLSFYIGNLTGIQADRLMQPFKGMWIKATGRVQYLSANEFGRITVLITLPAHNMYISCEFDSKEWQTRLERLSNNDILFRKWANRFLSNETTAPFEVLRAYIRLGSGSSFHFAEFLLNQTSISALLQFLSIV
jgi:hypothetical protein